MYGGRLYRRPPYFADLRKEVFGLSAKKNNVAVIELENKLKKAHLLNYILIALCAVLIVVCIVVSAVSCSSGKGTDLPSEETVTVPNTENTEKCEFTGTYQYVSNDDSYGFALEFAEDGAVWFYEATKDETLLQGFVGELIKDTSGSDMGYYIPLYSIDFTPYTTASVELELTENGNLRVTQTDPEALLSDMITVGSAVTLYPVENYSLSQAIIALYADEMAE